jgi:hypothetical protein
MQTYTWRDLLDLATDEAGVIALSRDFLASLDPAEVMRLPEACMPRKLFNAADIGQYALDLVREHSDGFEGAAPLVHRMAAFFAQANFRLSQLLARNNDAQGDVQGGGVRESA